MFERVKHRILRILRVPPEPRVPDGGEVRIFRAGRNYLRMKLAYWGLSQLGAVAGLVGSLMVFDRILEVVAHPWAVLALTLGEVLAWATFAFQAPFRLVLMRLDFDQRWYILTDRALRIREGVLNVREKTVTFANIQQISIRQNPLQRLLGLADVQVTTAGGGPPKQGDGVLESMHEAYFRGVDNAEEIRDVIQERVRQYRDAGLGDPDEPAQPVSADPGLVAAARELRDEMRLLRLSAALD